MKKTYIRFYAMLIMVMVCGLQFSKAQCPTITCPSNITVNNDPGTCGAVVNYTAPVGTNSCPGPFTFNYTGSMQTWTVPAGVTSVIIETWGAQGQGGNGGNGGYAKGIMTVSPGQILNIFVGGQNGYNGGGIGHAATPRNGGGASDVRAGGTTLNDRVIVAGGGGSSSGDVNYMGGTGGGGIAGANYVGGGGGIGYGGNGGAGGLNGGVGNTSVHSGGAGGGGFTSGGGGSCNTGYGGTCGQAGTLGTGGNGDTWENGICYNSYGGTSGGGGGYYGGGGSSVGNCGSGGGGGGSSWTGSLISPFFIAGNRSGDGLVTISVPLIQTFNYTGTIQTWTVPAGVTSVNVDARGAQGGNVTVSCSASGGLGARMSGDIAVTPGEVLSILVGQQGLSNGSDAGGGGGSFVVGTGNVPLVIAGGGGGATNNVGSCGANRDGINATITTSGTAGANGLGAGGTGGNGGSVANGGSGTAGGGFLTDGANNGGGTGGKSYLNGGAGGVGLNNNHGGFGGGGCGWHTGGNGGGGGGYSGGGTSGAGPYTGGGGGGSYNAGTNQLNTAGVQYGNGQVTITYSDIVSTTQTAGLPSGSTFPVGTTVQTFTATDLFSNTISCSFNVVVNDNEAPVPDVVNLPDLTDECSVTTTLPTATDNCSGAITATTTDSLNYNTQGNFTINWSYDDGNGNITTQTQNVIINDVTPPTFTCPTDFTTCAGTPLSIAPSAVTDNCGGTVAVTYVLTGATTASGTDDASGEVFNPGVTTVTYTFDDGNGNTANCGFDVTINTVDTSVTVNNFTLTANATGTYQWYNCGTSANIPGETNASYTATVNGSYAVIVTQNGCTDTSSCHIINGIGIEEISTNGLTLYPNPATDKITLSSASNEPTLVSIYDVQNKLMMQTQFTNTKQIDVSKLAKGIYLVRIQSQSKELNAKLVIQ